MTKFKDDPNLIIKAKSKLMSIISELGDIDSNRALEMIDWDLKKAKYLREHITHARYKRLPDSMQRGDIINVNFGINVGDEFSDSGTGSHFAIYWAQNGLQIIVIPISAEERKPEKNDFAVNIGIIDGLPKSNVDTYAKVDMIRSVNLRRISRIYAQKNGKISLSDVNPGAIINIAKKISEKFLDNVTLPIDSKEIEEKDTNKTEK